MDFSLVLLVSLVSGIVSTAHAARYEATVFYGCFESCDCKVQLHWDGDQVMYADFKSGETVWTAPLLSEVENTMSAGFYILAQVSKERLCKHYLPKATQIDKNPTEEKAPRMLVYPSEEAELGKEITLYCYISHFYPPLINVTWTRNGFKVTEGVALSNPQPETDGTFSQLASLSFHPKTDDVLGCIVQHQALSHPVNTAWVLPVNPDASGAVACLSLGVICLTVGVIIFIISASDTLRQQLFGSCQTSFHRAAG
ncbi:RLA class II histocompatibility antigen, DP alpha-1 chain-like [Thunnus albacares]|uniref:RLA class II histocompatibility antigen, DP alpha-1 chain-like n=1 Tax=Thunnus albacares TaxID=8236 RepID=UPI001CF68AC0|nr:RLA class II histocompatibility antigen, DP alpha-1 chain-like [Thunnus albacares]